MTPDEFLIKLNERMKMTETSVKLLQLSDERTNDILERAVKMLQQIPQDLNNIYKRLDALEEK